MYERKGKASLFLTALTMAWSAGAVDISTASPTTTDRIKELLTGTVNYVTGDCSALTFSQVADTVTVGGNNQWSATDVTFDLGSVSKVFAVPNLHFRPGGSLLLKRGTLETTKLYAGENAGEKLSKLTIQGSESRLRLAGNTNWGASQSSTEFYLLDGASMMGNFDFVQGYAGLQSRYALVDGADTTMEIKDLKIGSGSAQSVMDIRDATITVTNMYVGAGNFFPGMSAYVPNVGNRLTLSNAVATVRSGVYVGEKASYNQLEVADGSELTTTFLYVGHQGVDNVNSNGFANAALVTGRGTTVRLRRPGGSLSYPALRVGYMHSATNVLTIADQASVTVDGTFVIGQESDSCANTVRVDNATLTIAPTSGSHSVYVGYNGSDDALIIENGGRFVANGASVSSVAIGSGGSGKRNLLAVRNRASAEIGILTFPSANNPRVEVDDSTLVIGNLDKTSNKPLVTLKGASPRLQVNSVSYSAMTNRFVLGATTKTAAQRDDFMYHLGTTSSNAGTGLRFEVTVEKGCQDGTYKLLDWDEWSGYADVNVAALFTVSCPEGYKVALHTQSKDTGVRGNYVTVSVKEKKGLLVIFK